MFKLGLVLNKVLRFLRERICIYLYVGMRIFEIEGKLFFGGVIGVVGRFFFGNWVVFKLRVKIFYSFFF